MSSTLQTHTREGAEMRGMERYRVREKEETRVSIGFMEGDAYLIQIQDQGHTHISSSGK